MLKTLDQALKLLHSFTRERPQWGVRELAAEMQMSHTVAYRMLVTFTRHGLLTQDPETKKYRLGLKVLEYGGIIRDQLNITDIIYPVMKALSDKTGESIFLTWLDGSDGICTEIVESNQSIKYALSVGSRTPLYAGASNKVIMAYMPIDVIKAILEKGLQPKTPHTIANRESLLQNLETIKKAGWAYSQGEYTEDTFGVAMPIFDSSGKPVASLTIAGPTYRMSDEKVPEMVEALRKSIDSIHQFVQQIM
ncbi:IclR family transcriptional regulator [Brevibacillus fluminis]|uniref:IclR family transcriptional regulator n=1 Tax=Brevibacillus fluminis TaxID=511487 RepID=UPI003F8AB252